MSSTTKAICLVNGSVELTDKKPKEVFKFERAIAVGDDLQEIRANLKIENALFGRVRDRYLNRVREAEKTGRVRLVSVSIVKVVGRTNERPVGNPS
jgi:hypothetical protein